MHLSGFRDLSISTVVAPCGRARPRRSGAEKKHASRSQRARAHADHRQRGRRRRSGAGDRRVLLWSLNKFVPLMLIDTGHSNRVKVRTFAGVRRAFPVADARAARRTVHGVDRCDALHWLGRQDGARVRPQRGVSTAVRASLAAALPFAELRAGTSGLKSGGSSKSRFRCFVLFFFFVVARYRARITDRRRAPVRRRLRRSC